MYIDEAILNGAKVIILEKQLKNYNKDIIYIIVDDIKIALKIFVNIF